MNEFSKEIIEIEGKEYTLFLNRQGIVALEKFTRGEKQEIANIQKTYEEVEKGNVVQIDDTTNPFDGLEDFNVEGIRDRIYEKLFWIMLNTTHKLSFSEAKELYAKAKQEYGNQVIALCDQMLEDANLDRVTIEDNKETKKLEALRPTK
jgi:DNA gyrase/topoisomerase IV subunit B